MSLFIVGTFLSRVKFLEQIAYLKTKNISCTKGGLKMEKHKSFRPAGKIHWKSLLFGLVAVYLSIVILTTIFASLIYFANVSEFFLQPVSLVIDVISLFIGGFLLSRKAGERGLLHGLLLALLFFLIAYLLGSTGLWSASQSLLKIASCFLAASLGGILGVK
jgi:putative membrane protein (TIGR04086 family)